MALGAPATVRARPKARRRHDWYAASVHGPPVWLGNTNASSGRSAACQLPCRKIGLQRREQSDGAMRRRLRVLLLAEGQRTLDKDRVRPDVAPLHEEAAGVIRRALASVRGLRPYPDQAYLHLYLAGALSVRHPEQARQHALEAVARGGHDPNLLTRAAWRMQENDDLAAARDYAALASEVRAECFVFEPELRHLQATHLIGVDTYAAKARLRALWGAGHRLAGLAADLAELHAHQGEDDSATRVVAEGLAADPDDERLLALRARLARGD